MANLPEHAASILPMITNVPFSHRPIAPGFVAVFRPKPFSVEIRVTKRFKFFALWKDWTGNCIDKPSAGPELERVCNACQK